MTLQRQQKEDITQAGNFSMSASLSIEPPFIKSPRPLP